MSDRTEAEIERVAKALWADSFPDGATSGVLEKPIGDGWTMGVDLDLDWELNRKSYMRLARIAINEVDAIDGRVTVQ